MENENPQYLSRAVAGVQPTNKLHIGNYFGAVKQSIDLQRMVPYQNFCFVADYHAQTIPDKKDQIADHSFEMAVSFLSLGMDPKFTVIYRQSDIPEVLEIMWLLALRMSTSELDRGHKMKVPGIKNAATYLYPLLMAADILGLRANLVPVGDDQQQHLERARQAARKFNSFFKEPLLPLPERAPTKAGSVPGTDSTQYAEGRKMSKSYNNIVPIFCTDDETETWVNGIATQAISYGQPIKTEKDTVYNIYKLVTTANASNKLKDGMESGQIGYEDAKNQLTAALNSYFAEARDKRESYLKRPDDIWDILREGAGRVRVEMRQTLDGMRELTGIGRYTRF